ncbi:MAG: preprotein translocase subunit SecE [Phycisphaerae bacterium]|nr:preprotein translocase subunit SecE [Phycisphaerae bacterium]
MSQFDAAARGGSREGGDDASRRTGPGQAPSSRPPAAAGAGGLSDAFRQYKPQQGRTTRVGTLVSVMALAIWGGIWLQSQLRGFEGDNWWNMLITMGIPMFFVAAIFGLTYWVVFANRPASDFLIATEGEMKKVNWSTRREIIGSTKVVILFTFLLAVLLFIVDLVFQWLFQTIGVLKV